MMHCVGNLKKGRQQQVKKLEDCFRNHYSANPDSKENKIWENLVKRGLGYVRREPDPSWMPYRVFGVTEAGFQTLLSRK